MFTNRIIATAFTVATVFAASAAHAQVSAMDKMFMTTLSHGNNAEIAASKIAVKKSGDKEVRAVAQTIIAGHSKNDVMLATLARKVGVALPNAPTATQKKMAAKLATMSGKAFDKMYLAEQIKAHHATIALLQKEIATSENSEIRDYATQTLGAVLAHTDSLHKAQGTSANKKMNKMGGRTTGMVSPLSPAQSVNARIRALNSVGNPAFATPKTKRGTFDGKPLADETSILQPNPVPRPAPGLD